MSQLTVEAITREQAEELLKEMLWATVEVVKQTNSRHGGVTKKAALREYKAASAIFEALLGNGHKLSPEEWERISN